MTIAHIIGATPGALKVTIDDPKLLPAFVPTALPVSMLDVDRSPPMDMELPMADPCPICKGFCMRVGDYVCFGFCYRCYPKST